MSEHEWKELATIAAVGGAVITIVSYLTSKKWTGLHTTFAVLSVIAFIGLDED